MIPRLLFQLVPPVPCVPEIVYSINIKKLSLPEINPVRLISTLLPDSIRNRILTKIKNKCDHY